MTDTPEMIALRWEPGAAVTNGLLMAHPEYQRWVREDIAAARVAAAYEAAARRAENRFTARRVHADRLFEMDYEHAEIDSKTVSAKADEAESIAVEIRSDAADPDGQAALARLLAAAKAEGMREAAGIVKTHHEKAKREYDELDDDASDFREGALWGRELIAREIAADIFAAEMTDAILAAADKVAAK